jgi:hypothetical protein
MLQNRKFWRGHLIKPIIILLATILLIGSAGMVFSLVLSTFAKTSASATTGTDLIQSSIGTIRLKPQFNVD